MDEDKPSLEELAHVGVLGMKWGHRKSGSGTDIRIARKQRDAADAARYVAAFKVAKTKRGTEARDKAKTNFKRKNTAYKNHPAHVLASRLTRGEKAALVVFATPVALPAILASSAVSRRAEYKLDQRKQTNKK